MTEINWRERAERGADDASVQIYEPLTQAWREIVIARTRGEGC